MRVREIDTTLYRDYGMSCVGCGKTLYWGVSERHWGVLSESLVRPGHHLRAWSSDPQTHDHYPEPKGATRPTG